MKNLMLTAAFAAISATAGAWGGDPPLPQKGQTYTKTFYGTKASNSPETPCKGATTRICGQIIISNNDGVVTQTNKDTFGFVLYHWKGSEEDWMLQHIDTGGDDGDDNDSPIISQGEWNLDGEPILP